MTKGSPDHFAAAQTVSWSDNAHFLLVTIAGEVMTVRVLGELEDGELRDVPRLTTGGDLVSVPIVVSRQPPRF